MHVLRPLYVVLTLVAIVFIARLLLVSGDFGIHERGYLYGWYRTANVEEWKAFPAKYRGAESCKACHAPVEQKILASGHQIITCENCHGPALEHPSNPPKLTLDRSRGLCLRCHAYLPYPNSQRAAIRGIDPDRHNPGRECALCHNPHEASKPH